MQNTSFVCSSGELEIFVAPVLLNGLCVRAVFTVRFHWDTKQLFMFCSYHHQDVARCICARACVFGKKLPYLEKIFGKGLNK